MLFEALLSILLLSIGMVALITMFQKAVRVVQFRQYYYAPARQVAESLLTQVELGMIPENDEGRIFKNEENMTFHYQINSEIWRNQTGLQQVTVIVNWSDRGKPGSLSLTTLLPVTEVEVD
ncbi:MAG: hypothetical protein ACE5HS_19745 [bacterium]